MAYIKDVQVGSDIYLIEPALYIAPSKSGAAYTAALANFSLITGATVQAKFAATNDANATLNVNSTGAKEIHYNGAKITANQFKANHVYTLVYDGTQWQVSGDIDTNTWRGIQDNLTSDSATDSLSAKQGKVLKGLIDAMDASTPAASGNATAFIDSITQTDGKITSITKKNIPAASTSTAGIIKIGTTANDAAAGNHNHDSIYSYIHLTDYDFTDTRPLSKYVTFDKSKPVGAPREEWYNGFISSHSNYHASYIINGHTHQNEWYVGHGIWREANTPHAPAPTWYLLAHSGNVSTGDNNGQVKIAGVNISVKGLAALAYKASLSYSDVGAAPAVTGGYLPLSGGQMTGPLTWKNSTALPETTSSQYFLVIDAFADGGTTKWISKANALTSLGAAASNHNHNGTYVPNTSGANDVNTIYNTGIYNITSSSLTNGPTGYGFGQLLVMSYRKHTGNTTPDYATQIYAHFGNGNNGNTLYYRTSNTSTWQTWQMVAHTDAATAMGNAKKPIYINAKGEIQEGDALKNLAYKDSLTSSDIPDNAANTSGNAATSTSAKYLYPFSDGTNVSSTTNIQILQTIQNSDDTPRSVPFGVKLQHGNTEVGFGYFYPKTSLYGGWYIASYSGPSYVAVTNGTWETYKILTNNNTFAGTNNAATLAWSTTYTIAKINGTDIKFTTMAKPSYAFTDLTEHPTTLSGYGITDAASSSHSHTLKIGNKSLNVSTSEQEWTVHDILYNSSHNIGTDTSWDIIEPGVYSVASSSAFTGEQNPSSNGDQSAPYTYGHAFTIRASGGGASQFYINHIASESKHSSRGIRYRSGWAVTDNSYANRWCPWATILDDKNFNLYAPTLTGTGASGSWSISITGTAAKATADASGNTITSTYAPLASPALTGTPTAPTAANGTNTTQIATTAFVNNTLSYVNAMRFKGTLGTGGTITTLPASHEAGDTYRVITAGTWAGNYCEVGTLIICVQDGNTASDTDWTSVETNEDGAVIGPTSSTNNTIVRWDGSSGRIIKNTNNIIIDDNGNTTIGNNSVASTLTVYGATTLSSTLGVSGATTLSSTLSVAENSTLTGKVGIGASPDNNYQLYVNGNSQFNGNLIPTITNNNADKTLGSSDNRWAKLYIGNADNHGDAYTPVYWNDGVPTEVTLVQQCDFTINSGTNGVRLTHAAINAKSYVTQIVVSSGESNLNSAISWQSYNGVNTGDPGYIELTCSAVSGQVDGYIMISRGGEITATATDIT